MTVEDVKRVLFVLGFFGAIILFYVFMLKPGYVEEDIAPAPDYVDEVPVFITIEKKATNTDVT